MTNIPSSSTPPPSPKDQLEERVGAIAVALLGALGEALEKTPEKIGEIAGLVEARLQTARTIGAVTVAYGKHETERRASQVQGYAEQLREPLESALAQALGLVGSVAEVAKSHTPGSATKPTTQVSIVRRDDANDPLDAGTATTTTSDTGLDPNRVINGYDTLSASQILTLIDSLSPRDAASLLDYESAHRKRKTVIARLSHQSEQ
jgi:hypothetical protein